MKKFFLSLFLLGLFTCCSKEESLHMIKEGYYLGYFDYQGIKYYSSIIIDKNGYSEGASGGVVYQKNLSSLTEGKLLIYEGNVIFDPQKYQMSESKIWERNPDQILDGAFKIIFWENDSISFSRGAGNKKIVYLLRRYIEKN